MPASPTISNAFIEMFESDVHLAFQRQGSKMLNTVRRAQGVGDTVHFFTLAKAAATQKARGSDVTPNNLTHADVSVTLTDYYSSEFIDRLDELKLNIDERQSVAKSTAWAIGRKVDDIIITALDAGTNSSNIAHGGTEFTQAKIQTTFEVFGNADVPDDGERYLVISPNAWTDLMELTQFSSADYVSAEQLPWQQGNSARRWMSFNVYIHSGLPKSGNVRNNFAYHRSAIGVGMNEDISMDITWQGMKQAWLVVSRVAAGSKIIDQDGVLEIQHDESVA